MYLVMFPDRRVAFPDDIQAHWSRRLDSFSGIPVLTTCVLLAADRRGVKMVLWSIVSLAQFWLKNRAGFLAFRYAMRLCSRSYI